jgi:hypothetical protein
VIVVGPHLDTLAQLLRDSGADASWFGSWFRDEVATRLFGVALFGVALVVGRIRRAPKRRKSGAPVGESSPRRRSRRFRGDGQPRLPF